MSVSGIMGTSASGMAAQSDRLNSTADNIANIATTGYKRSAVEFSTMVSASSSVGEASSGVTSYGRRHASEQGVIQSTQSPTDLAVEGQGFLVVQGPGGERLLTRSGAFVRDREGVLTNAAGYRLLATPVQTGTTSGLPASINALVPVSFEQVSLKASPSSTGKLQVNVPSSADVVPVASLPSSNTSGASYTSMTSLSAFDNLGDVKQLDVYFSKSGPGAWEVTVFDHAGIGQGSPFPYASSLLATTTLQFDPLNGQLQTAGATSIQVTVPDGRTVSIDLSGTTQLASEFSVRAAGLDGHPPVSVERVEISREGTVTAIYADGTQVPSFRIPLVQVASPETLTAVGGSMFAPNVESGSPIVQFPSEVSGGRILSGALELSTVDLATELTTMIEAQRNYTANSRVFQTASDLMDVIVNLRR